MFHIVEDGHVILRTRGVWKQAKVYRRLGPDGNNLYAGHGGGFIRLNWAGGTTLPNTTWESLEVPFTPGRDKLQRLTVPEVAIPEGYIRWDGGTITGFLDVFFEDQTVERRASLNPHANCNAAGALALAYRTALNK